MRSRRQALPGHFVVDNLQEALDQVKGGGAQLVGGVQEETYGSFCWFIDPEGNKVEQPK